MSCVSLTRRVVLTGALAMLVARPARSETALADVIARARRARFVAIGERHDNPQHHAYQAEIVAALQPRGLAFEMIPRESEDELNRLRREGAIRDRVRAALDWDASGWPDFDLYAPILEAAPEAVVTGGAVAKAITRKVYADGLAATAPELSERYGLAEPLQPALRDAMLEEQYEAHCRMMPREALGPMVDIQRLWDAAFADAWLRAGAGGGPSVLICGNGHARLDRGAPAALRRHLPDAEIFSIGQIEEGETPPAHFDAVLIAPAPERDDPCAAMRKAMERKTKRGQSEK